MSMVSLQTMQILMHVLVCYNKHLCLRLVKHGLQRWHNNIFQVV